MAKVRDKAAKRIVASVGVIKIPIPKTVVVTGSAEAAETESVQAALKAFSLAVEQHVPLIGVNDLGRWQAVQQKLVNSVGGRSEKIQVGPADRAEAPHSRWCYPDQLSPKAWK